VPPSVHEHFIYSSTRTYTRTRIRRDYARPGLPTARISPPEHVSDVQPSQGSTVLTARSLRVSKATSDLHPRYSQIANQYHRMTMHENR
jgi:hypothetical protein